MGQNKIEFKQIYLSILLPSYRILDVSFINSELNLANLTVQPDLFLSRL